MRNKRLVAGSHLLPPHVTGAWSYGFYSHYPHGPYPVGHNSRCLAGERLSCSSSLNLPAPQMQAIHFCCSCFPPDSGLAPLFGLQPILAATGLRPRQPRLPATGDCGTRFGDFKNLANMAPPFSVPKKWGESTPCYHISTKPQSTKERAI